MPTRSQRLKSLPPYPLATLNQRIRDMEQQGIDIIRLDAGNPCSRPPQPVIDCLYQSANQPAHHGYTGYRGTLEFREAVAGYYDKRFGVRLDPETEVLPLIGTKEGIVNLSTALLDPGDIVLIPAVSYPSYSIGAQLAGAQVHWLPVNEASHFLPDLSSLPAQVARRAKLLWLNYPNNPTGAVAPRAFYQRTVDFCIEHDILLASDIAYADVTYDGYRGGSALQIDNATRCAVEFMSLSKTYNMAGWRLGAAVGCPDALNALFMMKSNIDSGHFRPVYDAGIAAFQTPPEWIDQRNKIYQRRRDRILDVLPQIGLRANKPLAALYIWARVEEGNGQNYARDALHEARVSMVPGLVYGDGGDRYVRLSLTVDDDYLDQALQRLQAWACERIGIR